MQYNVALRQISVQYRGVKPAQKLTMELNLDCAGEKLVQ